MSKLSPTAIKQQYSGDEEHPLGGYVGAMTVYAGLVATLSAVVKVRKAALPDRVEAADLALIALATHKLSRLVAKDPVTSPVRAPFTRFERQSGEAELAEEVIGHGAQHAVGELLTCPFCLAQWAATGFVFGSVIAPRATRLVASVFSAVAVSDFLQLAYGAAQDAVSG